MEYTSAELRDVKADLLKQPAVPTAWRVVELPPPSDGFEEQLVTLAAFVVGGMLTPLEECNRQYDARKNLVGWILACQAHGEDGGALFEALSVGGEPMHRVLDGGKLAKKAEPCAESVLVAHAAPAGTAKHQTLLDELQGDEGVRAFELHDLRASEMAAARVALTTFLTGFKEQRSGAQIAFVKQSQTQGTNDFAKNVTAIVAVGGFTPAQLKQLGGRLGRPCELVPGDIVPKAFKLVHLRSQWAADVGTINQKKTSPRGVPDAVWAQLDAVKASMEEVEYLKVEERTLRLVAAERLMPDCALAERYLELVRQPDKKAAFLAEFEALVAQWSSVSDE